MRNDQQPSAARARVASSRGGAGVANAVPGDLLDAARPAVRVGAEPAMFAVTA